MPKLTHKGKVWVPYMNSEFNLCITFAGKKISKIFEMMNSWFIIISVKLFINSYKNNNPVAHLKPNAFSQQLWL